MIRDMAAARRKKPRLCPRGTVHLPVVVEHDEDRVFNVSIPTLAGCHSYGYTLEEAMRNIAEAAELCLEDESPSSNGTFVGVRDLLITQ